MNISQSKFKSYNRCKRAYWYKHIKDWAPKQPPLPMKRGTWLHILLEAHYVSGDWRKVYKKVLLKEWDRLLDEEKDRFTDKGGTLPEICYRIMESYEHYYRDEDSDLEIVATETEVEVPLPHGHTLTFKFDMIAEDEYGRWLWENKSHGQVPKADYRFIDVQSSAYVWGLNRLGTYGRINGIMWNYLRTKPPTVPKINKNGAVSKRKIETDFLTFARTLKKNRIDFRDYRDVLLRLRDQPSPFFSRVRQPKPPHVAEKIVRDMVRVADLIEKGVQPIRSIDRTCEQCMFLEPCIASLYGGDERMILKAKFEKRKDQGYHASYEEIGAIV